MFQGFQWISDSKVHSYVSIAHSIFVFLQVSGYELISFGKFCCTIATLGAKVIPRRLFMQNRGNVVCFSSLKTRSFVSIFRMLISAYLFWGASTLQGCSSEVRWPIPKFPHETHSFSSITFQRTQNYLLKMSSQKIRYIIFLW